MFQRLQNVEGKSKLDQWSLVKQCQQYAHNGDKVVMLNKCNGLPLDRDPQEEDWFDAAESKDTADYNLDIDYVGSEPEVEPVAQDEREVDPDSEYVNMEISQDGTLGQRMMPQEQYMGILWVHRAQGPEIMALKLQNMYIQL